MLLLDSGEYLCEYQSTGKRNGESDRSVNSLATYVAMYCNLDYSLRVDCHLRHLHPGHVGTTLAFYRVTQLRMTRRFYSLTSSIAKLRWHDLNGFRALISNYIASWLVHSTEPGATEDYGIKNPSGCR